MKWDLIAQPQTLSNQRWFELLLLAKLPNVGFIGLCYYNSFKLRIEKPIQQSPLFWHQLRGSK